MFELKDLFFRMSNDFYNNDIDNDYVFTYCLLMNHMSITGSGLNTINNMINSFGCHRNNINKNKEILRSSIQWLVENEYIECYDSEGNTLNINNVGYDEFIYSEPIGIGNYFFKVNILEMNKILKYIKENKIKQKSEFFRYFILCCRCTNNENNIGYISSSISNSCIKNRITKYKYNEILETLGIFYNGNNYSKENSLCSYTYFGRASCMTKEEFLRKIAYYK